MDIRNNVLFKKKELLNFCILRFIFGISYSFMIPIISLYFDSLGIGTLLIGIIMSLYGVSKALAQVPFGMVSDAIGDKLLLIVALVLMSCIPFAYTIFHTKILAGSIYIIQGAVLGMSAPANYSILSRSLDEEKRGECTGYASAVFTLGGAIGAIIGGFIVSNINNYNMVFYVSSIGIIISLIFTVFKINKSEKIMDKCKKSKGKLGCRIRVIVEDIKENKLAPKIILLSSVAFLGDFIYGCIGSMFPFYGQDVLGGTIFYTSSIISIYLFVFGLFAPLGGWTSDKIGVKRQLFLSFIVMNLSLFALSFIRGITLFTIVIIIYFLGATFLNASLQNSLMEFGEDENIKGIVFGFVGASESLGYAVGPLISSYVYKINKGWLFLVLLGISLIVSSIFLLLKNKALTIKV
ncbi:MFS transporter [Clostridium sp. LIBA-8841]|uniref:MFS transporter n=1 Tax=Clostridium sp. LIBA-8841 TaxID=2987530 RepID=UPI002AC5BDE9|nr:MFS transporter [Clostridium sp. LIBA-8841]MDZ5254106.1 MFS transporter [Clostridium sp. LIBA-8841]